MSPQTKINTKWILTTLGSVLAILLTVIGATASITTKFNVNDADHSAIKATLVVETEKTQMTVKTIKEMSQKLDEFGDNQIKVMTNQAIILEAIKDRD